MKTQVFCTAESLRDTAAKLLKLLKTTRKKQNVTRQYKPNAQQNTRNQEEHL